LSLPRNRLPPCLCSCCRSSASHRIYPWLNSLLLSQSARSAQSADPLLPSPFFPRPPTRDPAVAVRVIPNPPQEASNGNHTSAGVRNLVFAEEPSTTVSLQLLPFISVFRCPSVAQCAVAVVVSPPDAAVLCVLCASAVSLAVAVPAPWPLTFGLFGCCRFALSNCQPFVPRPATRPLPFHLVTLSAVPPAPHVPNLYTRSSRSVTSTAPSWLKSHVGSNPASPFTVPKLYTR
jgi:hypothetical protein